MNSLKGKGHILPVELLQQIFKTAFEDLTEEYKSDNHEWFYLDLPLILSAVCGLWRQVALQTPLLWAFIQINLANWLEEEKPEDGVELLHQWITRSKGFKLQLCIESFHRYISYSESTYPLSEINFDRVWYFSLAYRGNYSWRSDAWSWSLNLKTVVAARVCGNIPNGCNLWIKMPEVRKFRLLVDDYLQRVDNHLQLVMEHPNIQSLVLQSQFITKILSEWDIWRGNRPLEQLMLLSGKEPNVTDFMPDNNVAVDDLGIEDCSSWAWKCIADAQGLVSGSKVRLRRFSGLHFQSFHAIIRPNGGNTGTRIVYLELADVSWAGVPWYFLLMHLPNLAELKIEYNAAKIVAARGESLILDGSPNSVLDELPRLVQKLGFLSKFTIISIIPLDPSGLIKFATESNRSMEVIFSSSCFTAVEREQLRHIPLVTLFVAAAQRTEGIKRSTRYKPRTWPIERITKMIESGRWDPFVQLFP